MSSYSDSWLFPVPESDLPQRRLNANDPACGTEVGRYIATYCTKEGTTSTSRGGFVEYWVMENEAALPGLAYINQTCAVLDRAAMTRALDGIEAAFALIATLPALLRERWTSDLGVADILAASDDVVERYLPGDGEDPFYLILHLRSHRRVLKRALETHGFAMYLLFNPYSDDADPSTWEQHA